MDGPTVDVGQRSKAHNPDAKGADLEGQIFGERLDCAKCCANRGGTWHVPAGRAARHENDHASVLLDHMARGSTGVIKRDFTIVASGTINSSIGNSTAIFPFPYSLARGPAASRSMSILPVWFTMPVM